MTAIALLYELIYSFLKTLPSVLTLPHHKKMSNDHSLLTVPPDLSLYLKVYPMYNKNIIKKRSALTLLPATSTVRVVVVKNINSFSENHPFASYGAGWFSCFLIRFSERYMHLLHAQSPSELLVEIQEMFP